MATPRLCPACGAKVLRTDDACWACGMDLTVEVFRPLARA